MKKALWVLCLLPLAMLRASSHYPSPTGYVTDAAHILDAETRQTLEGQLTAFEQSTSIEIAVATIPSLEGEDIEGYTNALFAQWKVGKKDKDNGVLLLVAPNDRKMRIEVGYGLESVLPDGLCGQIIREDIAPRFRENHYAEGIVAGVQSIQKAVQGQYVAPVNSNSNGQSASLFFAIFLLIFFVPMLYRLFLFGSIFGGGYGGYGGGSFGGGGGFGGFGGGSSGGGGASGGW